MADKKTSNAEEPKKRLKRQTKLPPKARLSLIKRQARKSPQRKIHSNPWASSSRVLIPSVKR